MIEDLPGEIWKDIVGGNGNYQVSNKGRVKSTDIKTWNYSAGKFITRPPALLTVRRRNDRPNCSSNKIVSIKYNGKHRVVCLGKIMYEAFIGPVPKGYCVYVVGEECNLDNLVLAKNGQDPNYVVKIKPGDYIQEVFKVVDLSPTPNGNYRLNIICPQCNNVFSRLLEYKGNYKCPHCGYIRMPIELPRKYNPGDIIGDFILVEEYKKNGGYYYTVKCKECGAVKTASTSNVVKGICKCKCKSQSVNTKTMLNELGIDSNHLLYKKYQNMIRRCYNASPKSANYKNYTIKKTAYSGDGINICKLWLDNFPLFYEWALANGWNENLHIDRIDSDGDYGPWNCQFLTMSDNTQKIADEKKIKEDPELNAKAKKDYYDRMEQWVKEMEAQGYKREELI